MQAVPGGLPVDVPDSLAGTGAVAEEPVRPPGALPPPQGQALGERRVPTGAGARPPVAGPAIVYVLLSTGLRREELLNLNLDQLAPNSVAALRQARQGRLTGVQGKGGTSGRSSSPPTPARRWPTIWSRNDAVGSTRRSS